MKWIIILVNVVFIINCWGIEHAHEIYLSGEYMHKEGKDTGNSFLEYYPSLQFNIFKSGNIVFDSNFEAMARGENPVNVENSKPELAVNIYRAWLRSSVDQSEFRIGLQKINFGPAQFIRSLQWFDRINALDPRQHTEGVWSMLLRYYTLENSNFWFWALYDEHELKGHEILQSREDTVEMGGRIQLPILGGDLGFSFHNRAVSNNYLDERITDNFKEAQEIRYGFDGRWDIGIGIWFESSISVYQEIDELELYLEEYTIGSDYTFELGNGLHTLAEHGYLRSEDRFLKIPAREHNISILTLDYPIGLYDKLMFLSGYYHEDNLIYYYASYNIAFDYVSIYFNASIIPEKDIGVLNMAAGGRTLQLLLQFNY